jgi:glyoxylase-like metal-dependent hydrolase (beta-lactamase superfamily II)
MIQIKTFVFNPFQENTYLIYDETNSAAIVDPGCYFQEEQKEITKFIRDNKLKPEYIILTHGHIDHILGTDFLKAHYSIKAIMHQEDLQILRRSKEFGDMIGLSIEQPGDPEILLKDQQEITFGNTSFQVFHVPGHSPGSIALYNQENNILVAGDVLFRRGIGRSDLAGGNHTTLINSIKNKLFSLNENAVVYSGHGETTTLKEEMTENPLLT